jgi:membrane protein
LPPDTAAIVKEQAHKVAANAGGQSVGAAVGILIALYSAGKGMTALIEGLNIIYDEQEGRGFIRLDLVALGLMLVVIVAMIVAIGAIIIVPDLAEHHRPRADRGEPASTFALANSVRVRAGHSGDHLPLWAEPCAGALALGQLGRGRGDRYLDARLNCVLRPELRQLQRDLRLARRRRHPADVVLAVGLQLGAELNSEMEHQTKRDSTTGRPKPLGRRGAYVADHVGETP